MAWIGQLLQLLAITIGNHKLHFSPQIGGEHARLGEIPYQVSLQNTDSSSHFCGGSILNEKYVITAAHCVVGLSPTNIKVIAGSIDLKDPKVTYEVENIIIHEKYCPFKSWINDIALLRIKNEFRETENLRFVPLPTKNFVIKANDAATVSGWGQLGKKSRATTNKLQRVDIIVIDQNDCVNRYKGTGENIYDTQVCAQYSTTEKGICSGDSGGPLTVKGKLVGLVSWSVGCVDTFYPSVYTRVSSYFDWIQSNAV